MKNFILGAMLFVFASGCVKNIDNGEPPYVLISLNNSFTDAEFYDDTLTDSTIYDFTLYLKSFNEAEIGKLLILKNHDDTLLYKEYSNLTETSENIEFLPQYGLLSDTTVSFLCLVKPLNSDIVSSYNLYFKISPNSK